MLSASANKLLRLKEQAEEYAALIMEELDPERLGYIEVGSSLLHISNKVFIIIIIILIFFYLHASQLERNESLDFEFYYYLFNFILLDDESSTG